MIRLFVVLLLWSGTNLSGERLELARNGRIQDDAPVKASSEITINAQPERVWHLLATVQEWPAW